MGKMVDGAEQDLAELVYRSGVVGTNEASEGTVQIRSGTASDFGLSEQNIEAYWHDSGLIELRTGDSFGGGIVGFDPVMNRYIEVRARSHRARKMVRMIYGLLIGTLLAGYGLVAVALEFFVLPQHVYQPIRALLDADDAARMMDSQREIVPISLIPADELGEIMHSRNETVRALRLHERELGEALARLESVAIDLHTKNRLLETARKNLEGADRLASLGMMSAGIAHELNTPLSVVKGLVERLDEGVMLNKSEVELLVRVVGRIERLSEGLLDFARVRKPRLADSRVHQIIEDAWTLIRLDRQSVHTGQHLEFSNEVDVQLIVSCDPDRMVQVFVNLIRNAVQALRDIQGHPGTIRVWASEESRADGRWVVLSVQDNGIGIEPQVLDTLFEPFVSSNLDSKGTGLGLAVAEGIVREHGGMVVPSNIESTNLNQRSNGARFDVHLPLAESQLK